jgi:DNA-3-methyladenine glycosylase II
VNRLFKKAFTAEVKAFPPYSFELTVRKPAGWWWSTPREIFYNSVLYTTARLNSRLYGLRLESNGASPSQEVQFSVFSDKPIRDREKDHIIRTVERALGVKENINEFYEMAQKDTVLRQTVEDLWGMRTLAWPELFPSLILAITLQMAPMSRSNQMMNLLIENFGEAVEFDGRVVTHWPSPERLAMSNETELRNKAKLGYRARNLTSIAQSLREGFPTADQLSEMPPADAKKLLMTLRGIGDYSADLVAPGMGFPLDVWSAKIFGILLLGKEPEAPRMAIPELKRIAEKRWGKWRGHAFAYILNDLPGISKRIGVDLTRF